MISFNDLLQTRDKVSEIDIIKNDITDIKSDKVNILPLDIVREFIEAERNNVMRNAKRHFLKNALDYLKLNDYFLVNKSCNIINYLPYAMCGFFSLVSTHNNNSLGRMGKIWKWNFFQHDIFITTIDNEISDSNYWLNDRNKYYLMLYNKGNVHFLKKTAISDFIKKFLDLKFFSTYETAKAYMLLMLY